MEHSYNTPENCHHHNKEARMMMMLNHRWTQETSKETNNLRTPLEEPGPVLKRYATPPSPKGWRAQVMMVQY